MMMLPNQFYEDVIAQKIISYNVDVGFCMLCILVFPLLFGALFKVFSFSIFPRLIILITLILTALALLIYQQEKIV